MKALYTFLLLVASTIQVSHSTIIYTDVAPDLVTVPSSTAMFDVDLDNNTTTDFRFTCVDVSGLRFIIVQAGQVGLGNFVLEDTTGGNHYVKALASNTSIAPNGVFWHAMSSTNPTLLSDFLGTYTGLWINSQDYYMGVKFLIGSNTHYGWIRLNINQSTSVTTLKDYAYEDQPNTPILAGALPGASVASNVVASDVAENSNGLDLQVTFDKASNENTVLNYRLIVVKDSVTNFDLSAAQAITATSYQTIAKTGSNISTILTASSNDADGDPIVIDRDYKVYVLSVADTLVIHGNGLSNASNTIKLNTTADVAANITCSDAGNNHNGSDIEINFQKAANEAGIMTYRVIVVKSSVAATFDISKAENVSLGSFVDINPTGGNILNNLTPSLKDSDDDAVVENVPYKAFVLSLANGTMANINALSGESNELTLKDTATGINNIEAENLKIYSFGSNIIIQKQKLPELTQFQLYDINGKLVHQQHLKGDEMQIHLPNLNGIFVAALLTKDNDLVRKVRLKIGE